MEDRIIEIVLEEQKQGEIDEVALAKAKMDAEGVEKKAETLYIRHRIRRIKDSDNANMALAGSIVSKNKGMGKKNDQEIKSTKCRWLSSSYFSRFTHYSIYGFHNRGI